MFQGQTTFNLNHHIYKVHEKNGYNRSEYEARVLRPTNRLRTGSQVVGQYRDKAPPPTARAIRFICATEIKIRSPMTRRRATGHTRASAKRWKANR